MMFLDKMKDKGIYFWAIGSKIITVLITLIITALINRALGVNLKGEYAYINNAINVLLVVLSMGLGMTYSTYKRNSDDAFILEKFVTFTYIQFFIVLGISIVMYAFNEIYVGTIFALTSVSILRYNLLNITAVEDVKKRDIQSIVYKIIYLFLILIPFMFLKKNLYVMLLVYFIDALITSLGLTITYRLRFISLKKVSFIEFFKLFKHGIISMLMTLMITLNYNLDIILLRQLSTSYYVGLYSVSVTLGNMLWIIPDAFKDVMFNKTSKEDSVDVICFLIKINLLIAIVIILGYSVLGKLFIHIMYGQEFVLAYEPTLILFIGCLSMIIFKIIHPLYIAKGKQLSILVILIISVISNTILNIVLIPQYNVIGAASSSVFSYTICSIILLFIFSRSFKKKMKDIIFINKNDIDIVKNKLNSFKCTLKEKE